MELLCVLAAVAALFCGCAVLTLKCRVPASVAPLTALSAIVAVLTLAGKRDTCEYSGADFLRNEPHLHGVLPQPRV